MLKTFAPIVSLIKVKPHKIIIDNLIFKLHYRFTTILLLVATILVTSREFLGEHIHCINDKGIENRVMNTFCFFTTTFTVERHMNSSSIKVGAAAHPGVGPYVESEDEQTYHAYYQWVPFVLFGQAIAFYIPHFIWKRQEGGRIKRLVDGLENAAFSLVDNEVKLSNGTTLQSKSKRDEQLEDIRNLFLDRLHVDKYWAIWFVFCEILNAINIIIQVVLTNMFLSGRFYDLGPYIIRNGLEDDVDILDEVFPKVTKCTFYKYGPTGTIQAHDAMCVMALNIINEKIYTFLWFWFVILGILTVFGLIWRALTIFLHSRSHWFNRRVFSNSCPGKLNPWQVLHITKEFHFTDWLFLYYLSKNMDGFVFMKLFIGLAEKMDRKKNDQQPLLILDDEKYMDDKELVTPPSRSPSPVQKRKTDKKFYVVV